MYELNCSVKRVEEKNYNTYGVSLGGVAVVKDISTDKGFVINLIDKFNRYELDKIHIMDVVSDIL